MNKQAKDLVCGIDSQEEPGVPVIIGTVEMEISREKYNGVFPFPPALFQERNYEEVEKPVERQT